MIYKFVHYFLSKRLTLLQSLQMKTWPVTFKGNVYLAIT